MELNIKRNFPLAETLEVVITHLFATNKHVGLSLTIAFMGRHSGHNNSDNSLQRSPRREFWNYPYINPHIYKEEPFKLKEKMP